jgi:predicted ArsR family transcriptional regulator
MTHWMQRLTGDTKAQLLGLLRRSRQTITTLADTLGVTHNAVRSHMAGLERDGVVQQVSTQRDTGGKPARVYALTPKGEELFPKGYALALGELVEEIGRLDGPEHATALLRSVGRRLGSRTGASADRDGRVALAAAALRGLGGDVEIQRTEHGYVLQGYGCPLSSVTAKHPQVCSLAQGLVEEITGELVIEECDRSDRPRCRLRIATGS